MINLYTNKVHFFIHSVGDTINQSKLFLKWRKWHSHCKDHWLGEVWIV